MVKNGNGNGMSWIKSIQIKRNAMASTVGLCQTTDEEREKELIAYLVQEDIISKPDIERQDVYEIDFHTGVSKVSRDGKNIKRNGVAIDGLQMALDPLEPMLRFVEGKAKSERVVVVIKNAIRQSNALDDFIESISYSDDWFGTESTTIVLTPDLSLFPSVVKARTFIVDVPLSTADERREKVHRLSKTYGLCVGDTDVERIGGVLSGLDLTNVESALIESVILKNEFDGEILSRVKSDAIKKNTDLKVILNAKRGFDSVGGCKYLKRLFNDSVIRHNSNIERAKKFALRPPKGILLIGGAGTGKTIFARALAKECNLPFIEFPIQEFMASGIVSESERFLAAKLKTIKEGGKCIVFVDEIDAIGGPRGKSGELDGGTMRRCENIFMAWLAEDRECIIVATTNRPQDLDKAFRRKGRFDIIAPILLPDDEGRREILKVHSSVVRQVPTQLSESEWMEIVEKTRWWNGAEIEDLVLRASALAEKDEKKEYVGANDFRRALANMRINIEERKLDQEQYLKISEDLATEQDILDEARASFQMTTMDRADRAKAKMDKPDKAAEPMEKAKEPTIKTEG